MYDRLFIDDHNGQWYLVDDARRGLWLDWKQENLDFEPSPGDIRVPPYAQPIYRNKPRAITFIGAKVEEWT